MTDKECYEAIRKMLRQPIDENIPTEDYRRTGHWIYPRGGNYGSDASATLKCSYCGALTVQNPSYPNLRCQKCLALMLEHYEMEGE